MQWGEIREMSVIVIWVQRPVSCACGEYDPRTPCATGDYSVSGFVSVNLTDDCRELGRNANKTSALRGLETGVHRNWALAGHEWSVENKEQLCGTINRYAVMRGLG